MVHFKKLNNNPKCLKNLKSIFFEYKSDVLSEKSKTIIRTNARCLSANPGIKIALIGHSDDREIREFKNELSIKRANQVKAFLVLLGLPKNRFIIKSSDQYKNVRVPPDEQTRSKNRRVDFLAYIKIPPKCDFEDVSCPPKKEIECNHKEGSCPLDISCLKKETGCGKKEKGCNRRETPPCLNKENCETEDVEDCNGSDVCLTEDDCHDDIPCNSEDNNPCIFGESSCPKEKPCDNSDTCLSEIICFFHKEDCGSEESQSNNRGGQKS
ncbi:MAG: OmpA family protein [Candidatus Aminicenantes bacterium]|nr:OmpA family protein [Candidatus Aminicenantes bacterium]